ncbi:g9939 [Coccomyxa elongata]
MNVRFNLGLEFQGLVTIDSVDIRYIGAQPKSNSGGRSELYTTIVHEGTSVVRARNCTDYQFVHDRTIVLHGYDTNDGTTTQPATFNKGGTYIKISPYTTWTLDFSQSLDDINFSRVTNISSAFTGDFAALDDRACVSVRTKGEGILLVPELVGDGSPPATTSFAAADAVSTASSHSAASLAQFAEDACPAVDFTVEVDPFAAATGDYYFGGILLDDGQLPFELPKYEGVAKIYTVPLEIPLNCTAIFKPPAPIADLLLLGSVPLEAVAGSTACAANFTITTEMGMKLKWKLPTLAGGYHVIVNVTSTSDAVLYDDSVDSCFTYKQQ